MSASRLTLVAAAAAALALPSAASAAGSPPRSSPKGAQRAPKGPFRTLTVCKRGCRYSAIQSAVGAARPGDTIRVRHGVYREGVRIFGSSKRYLKLVGDRRHPSKVVLDGRALQGGAAQNGIIVSGADQVTIDGLTARRYRGNGFFVVNVDGFRLRHLIATLTGVHGISAFNAKGGVMSDSTASWNNDSGFSIGQTPPQTPPKRSLVTRVTASGNVLGFSGTNMRYVTITKSEWFNNGLGIVPNALDSEKYAPPEDNVITDNDIFWNNFNPYAGAPFRLRATATRTPYPVGTGVLLSSSRRTEVTNNRVFGNFLLGIGGVQQPLLKQTDAQALVGNQVRGNVLGLGGADLNGRDLLYDGDGSGNCVGPNVGVAVTVPASGATFVPCPFGGVNALDPSVQAELAGWELAVASTSNPGAAETFWLRHPHAPRPGLTPLEHFTR